MEGARERLKRAWTDVQALGPGQRVLLGGSLLFGLIGIFFILARVFAAPSQVQVFSQLAPQDAAAITGVLSSDKIPYTLSPDGTSIFVPEPDAAQARLDVAGQGLPKQGNVGFQIFDQTQLGMSSFQQHVIYVQALEGQIAQTIDSLQQVQNAQVQIVLPRPSLFASATPPATAAVFVALKPYATLSASEVAGIQNLVSHSVQGLKPSDVTVVDSQGQVLMAGASRSPSATGDLNMQLAFDRRLEDGLLALLEPVLGPGNVVAHVSATLNFNGQTRVEHLFMAPKGKKALMRRISTLKESFKGTGTAPTIPGTSSNVPPTYTLGATGSKSSYTRSQTDAVPALDTEELTSSVAPGAVKRLSVAVIVNQRLTPAQVRSIRATVSAALGADPARHDVISVTGMPFNQTLAHQASALLAAQANQRLIQEGVEGLAILLLALLLAMLIRRIQQRPSYPVPALAGPALPEAPPPPRVPTPEELRAAEATQSARDHPEEVAAIVRTWLKE